MRTTLSLVAAATLSLGALSTGPVSAGAVGSPVAPVAPRAAAATPLGQVGTPAPCGVTGPGAVVINTLAAGSPSYTGPFIGVVKRRPDAVRRRREPGRRRRHTFASGIFGMRR